MFSPCLGLFNHWWPFTMNNILTLRSCWCFRFMFFLSPVFPRSILWRGGRRCCKTNGLSALRDIRSGSEARLWMVVKYVFFLFFFGFMSLFYFLAFWEAGFRDARPPLPARHRMDIRLSHFENKSRSVQRISRCRIGCGILFMLFGFTMCFFFSFSLVGVSR